MNKYHKKDVKILVDILKSGKGDWPLADMSRVYSSGNIRYMVISFIEAYGYRLPGRSFPYLKSEVSDFLFIVPFVDVPKYVNDETLKELAQWRLRIGR